MKKLLIILTVFGLWSCTNLDEEVYDTIVTDQYYQTEKQVLSAAGPAYKELRGLVQVGAAWGLNQLSSDEEILPTRGIHWNNGGIYRRLQQHTWTSEDGIINDSWKFVYNLVSNCNRLIYQFNLIEDKSEALITITNELRALRAFAYFYGMDAFGNIPIVDKFDVPNGYAPSTNSRKEVFDFVVSELEETLPNLSKEKDMTTYGRMNYYVVQSLLAKIYLNAEVYVGESMLDECLTACNDIIENGGFSLDNNYFANFAIENQGSPENIFVIPFDDTYTTEWGYMNQFQYWTLHFTANQTFGMEAGGWNGFCADPAFYRSYDEDDLRRNVWVVGPQYSTTGEVVYCNQELAGKPLSYSIDLTSLEGSFEDEGARLAKYDYTGAKNWTVSCDFAVIRYADILLMKAEALMRKNGGAATAEAVNLVNAVRNRAFADTTGKLYTTSTLTLEALLAERGWELAGEGWRRNDQIRFGTFTSGEWTFKSASPDTRNLFPIPQAQRNANPNLDQNPGY
ncbi:RagB/SusD family nutrient uptake outer membrane protein [Flavobacteriaceae bacterium GSB9]|nr:RagB/SusD family nutrient uptake outer membrane protein [Flavobacteriaceae bacterium GSB9]